jgi:hypothetical protein
MIPGNTMVRERRPAPARKSPDERFVCLAVSIPPALRDQLDEAQARTQRTASSLVRDALQLLFAQAEGR